MNKAFEKAMKKEGIDVRNLNASEIESMYFHWRSQRDRLAQKKALDQAVEKAQQETKTAFVRAKETGKPIFLEQTARPPHGYEIGECSRVVITKWAMPDGTVKISEDATVWS